ncbi:MAG TPA: PTS sugar transporter subunit IIA, partial [Alloiococcus sp.]|nr:PTS sugar transporter subunit IIA [Alloiococcus sp.]
MTEFKEFYREDLIFKSKARTKEEVFEEIGQILIDKDLVTEEFPSEIIKRENNFPTGLDLGIVVEDA